MKTEIRKLISVWTIKFLLFIVPDGKFKIKLNIFVVKNLMEL